jgi:hypothetical protein
MIRGTVRSGGGAPPAEGVRRASEAAPVEGGASAAGGAAAATGERAAANAMIIRSFLWFHILDLARMAWAVDATQEPGNSTRRRAVASASVGTRMNERGYAVITSCSSVLNSDGRVSERLGRLDRLLSAEKWIPRQGEATPILHIDAKTKCLKPHYLHILEEYVETVPRCFCPR